MTGPLKSYGSTSANGGGTRDETTRHRSHGFDGSRADGGPRCAFLALKRSCAHVLTAPILADVFTCAGCLWWTTRAESRIIVFISLVRSSRGRRAYTMIADAILSVLGTSGPVSLDDMRRMLSQVSYAGLRYQLARLQEHGDIERVGDAYRLKAKARWATGLGRLAL